MPGLRRCLTRLLMTTYRVKSEGFCLPGDQPAFPASCLPPLQRESRYKVFVMKINL